MAGHAAFGEDVGTVRGHRVNLCTVRVYREAMRILFFLFGFLSITTLGAQPGDHPLEVVFGLYHDGVPIKPEQLRGPRSYRIALSGSDAEVFGYGHTDLAIVRFQGRHADPLHQTDTLWMTITHQRQRMRIAFPPMHVTHPDAYPSQGLRIDFHAGQVVCTDLRRLAVVRGTIGNLDVIAGGNPYFDVLVRNGDHWSHGGVFDRATGRIEALLDMEPFREHGYAYELVDLTFVTRNWADALNTEMRAVLPFDPVIFLDTFDLIGTRVRMRQGRLVVDSTVPRDSVIAGAWPGLEVHLHPVNPSPTDTIAIELRWEGSGAPYVTSNTSELRPDGVTELRFTFALRTDVDVATDSWPEHARPFRLLQLPAGRYVLTQGPITGKDIAQVDFLLGREVPFVCAER